MVLCARSKNKKTIEPAQLCAFTRVNLNIGESELVRLNIQLPKSYNPQSKGWERHTSGFELRIGPNVLDVQRLALTAV
jgi:hypothetical protein